MANEILFEPNEDITKAVKEAFGISDGLATASLEDRILWFMDYNRRVYPWNELHVSHISGPCIRKRWFDLMLHKELGEHPGFPRATLGRFLIGELIHNLIQGLYPEANKEPGPYVVERDGYAISGTPDMIDRGVMCEIKSTNTLRFVLKSPNEAHIEQVNTYPFLMAEADETLSVVDSCRLIYATNSDLGIKEHKFLKNGDMWKKTNLKAELLFHAVVAEQAPNRTKCYECKWCNHISSCDELEL